MFDVLQGETGCLNTDDRCDKVRREGGREGGEEGWMDGLDGGMDGCMHSLTECVSAPNQPQWAASGECDANKGFMGTACAKACKLCTPTPAHSKGSQGLRGGENAKVRHSVWGSLSLSSVPLLRSVSQCLSVSSVI